MGDGDAADPEWAGISDRDVMLYQLSRGDAWRFWQLHHVPQERLERFTELLNADVRLNRG